MNKSEFRKIPRATITKALADSQIQCGICLDQFKFKEIGVRKLPCNHLYHTKCIFPWLQKHASCPYCRARLQNEIDVPLDTNTLLHRLRAGVLSLMATMEADNNLICQQQQRRRTLEYIQNSLRRDLSRTSAHIADHSQIEQPSIERRQRQIRQTPKERSSLTRRVRRAAAMRARSAIEDIYRR